MVLHSASRKTFVDNNKKKRMYSDLAVFRYPKNEFSALVNRLVRTQNGSLKKKKLGRENGEYRRPIRVRIGFFYVHRRHLYMHIYTQLTRESSAKKHSTLRKE